MARRRQAPQRIDFAGINRRALAILPSLVRAWLPKGKQIGAEYVALNPRRNDRSLGSFRINTQSGKWADFAVAGARGGDVISLLAYLLQLRQSDAALRLAEILKIDGTGEDGAAVHAAGNNRSDKAPMPQGKPKAQLAKGVLGGGPAR